MSASRTITIIVKGPNHFDVHEGERCSDHLCWDEMLGQIATLTHPDIAKPRYDMLTPEEHEAQRERWRQRDFAADEPTIV